MSYSITLNNNEKRKNLMIDPANLIPWGFTLLSVLITIYSLVKNTAKDDKKEAKETIADMTMVIVKLENIQQAVNKTGDIVTAIQNEMKSIDRRVTVIETKIAKLEEDDGR